jgi:hypothetical protein
MKPLLLALALPVLALTGCATGGYYGYDSGYYGPGYAYGPGYYGGPDVGIAYYGGGHYDGGGYYRGGFAHDYHHTSVSDHRSFATASHTSSFHTGTRVASTHSVSHASGASRSVSSGGMHVSSGGHGDHR